MTGRRHVRILFRPENDLRQSLAITQINKDDSTVVPCGINPARQGDGFTKMGLAQGIAMMGAVHDRDETDAHTVASEEFGKRGQQFVPPSSKSPSPVPHPCPLRKSTNAHPSQPTRHARHARHARTRRGGRGAANKGTKRKVSPAALRSGRASSRPTGQRRPPPARQPDVRRFYGKPPRNGTNTT